MAIEAEDFFIIGYISVLLTYIILINFSLFWMEILLCFVKLLIRTLHWYGLCPLSMPIWVFWMNPCKKEYVAYYVIIFPSSIISISQHECRLYASVGKLLTITWGCKLVAACYVALSLMVSGIGGFLFGRMRHALIWNRVANLHGGKAVISS